MNPCAEISLKDMQMCNLTTINASNIESQEDYNNRARAASIIGTLQASYTDFHYLRGEWKRNCEKDALLGVSMTGIASMEIFNYNQKEAAEVVVNTNKEFAELININKAARCTAVKPEGTASLVLGTSSGIHAWHNDYYLRRMRLNKTEPLYSYLLINLPEILEDDYYTPNTTAVITIPQKAPDNAVLRKESPIELLNRVSNVTNNWIKTGFRSGYNQHNVSCTVSIKDDEWDAVADWMWINRDNYSGISVLPYDTGTYKQTPFEDCTKEEYEKRMKQLKDIDLTKVVEFDNNTNLNDQAGCSGSNCEIK
jgi:ribonucleoside-diphosphate reductase alpha chain